LEVKIGDLVSLSGCFTKGSAKDDHRRAAAGEALQPAVESVQYGVVDIREPQQLRVRHLLMAEQPRKRISPVFGSGRRKAFQVGMQGVGGQAIASRTFTSSRSRSEEAASIDHTLDLRSRDQRCVRGKVEHRKTARRAARPGIRRLQPPAGEFRENFPEALARGTGQVRGRLVYVIVKCDRRSHNPQPDTLIR
jgi:hypothetical protein